MRSGKRRMEYFDVVRRFTEDFKISHYRVLCLFVAKKSRFHHAIHILVYAVNRLHDMAQVVDDAKRIRFTHNACASATT